MVMTHRVDELRLEILYKIKRIDKLVAWGEGRPEYRLAWASGRPGYRLARIERLRRRRVRLWRMAQHLYAATAPAPSAGGYANTWSRYGVE